MNDLDDIYKNIEEYIWKKCRMLIIYDNINADMLSNGKRNPIVTELIITGRKWKILLFLLHNLIFLYQKTLD